MLDWAIREAGLTDGVVAARLGTRAVEVEAWRKGLGQPRRTQLRELARFLGRPTAFFFLPQPPEAGAVSTAFRRAPGLEHGRDLLPEEIKAIRTARRAQRVTRWMVEREVGEAAQLPIALPRMKAADAAVVAREWLGWTTQDQLVAVDARTVAKELRERVQNHGVLVLHFSARDRKACRAFSLYDPVAPLVSINSKYTDGARSFSYLHEVGHLFRGDSAICSTRVDKGLERWCERFAAAFLLPRRDVEEQMFEMGLDHVGVDIEKTRQVAARFKASLTATAIQLVAIGRADPELFPRVDALVKRRRKNNKQQGGGGEKTAQSRVRELGSYTSLLLAAEEKNLLRRTDVLDYLSVNDRELGEIAGIVNG